MSKPDDATRAQIRAADPALSTWVSANAGSGKTRVLTDRVARLLLKDVPPQKILCLTYTKAAASHMQNQLFGRLGEWAMLGDDVLRKKLGELGEDNSGLTPEVLRKARTLFARALETPGGLKIQTIHSFCSSLLRRFPVEAGVSPQFQEMDERSGRKLRADILETLADGGDRDAFDGMAKYLSGDNADKFCQEILSNRDAFEAATDTAEIWAALDLPAGYDEAVYLSETFPDWIGEVLPDLRTALMSGSANDVKAAVKLGEVDWDQPSMRGAETLEGVFLFGSKTQKPDAAKIGSFPTKDTRNTHPDLMEAVEPLMLRFEAARPRRLGLDAARRTRALHDFANAFLPEYARLKQLHGWLDFDDLILSARRLLTRSSMAQWVLFKLDGGIDHILVDEAQDTSPEQWAVIARLAEEFSVGQSARSVDRTLFVVGDEKQSIYSFQGADPEAFDKMRAHFETRLRDAGGELERKGLLYSFRSSAAILRLVDTILQKDGKVSLTSDVTHRAFHQQLPGRVDLWPFLEKPEKEERPVWYEPLDTPATNDPALLLAEQIADAIKDILQRGETLPTTKGARPVKPGDFLILVQRRSDLFHEIIRVLKNRELPVAGADRLKIGAELAVRDLTALMSFMATPEDDLSLACALRSPLLRLSEGQLFSLAQPRKRTLWEALRNSKDQHDECFDMLQSLLDDADFLRPFELLERILTRHNGREYLIARLGKEAEEGIDALLTQALQYEQMEAPNLTGFLGWMSTDDSDIKRQMDTTPTEIRVMTVHGAKGLESPIVILPDTAKRMPPKPGEVLHLDGGLAVWKSRVENCPPQVKSALSRKVQFLEEERQRLLYVALTRAENWLIICGAGTQGKEGESWYSQVESGLSELGGAEVTAGVGTFKRFQPLAWVGDAVEGEDSSQAAAPNLPDWALQPIPAVGKPAKPLNPSDLGGGKIVAFTGGGLDEDAAKARGNLIHLLLEHLPSAPPEKRLFVAGRLLADIADQAQIDDVLEEVLPILEAPNLSELFSDASLSEVPVTAPVMGRPLDGIIDRLVVEDDRILAVDVKSNAIVPDTPEKTPESILRQMGAYAAALAQVYPGRRIDTAILWTRTASLMLLPHESVTDALKRASAS